MKNKNFILSFLFLIFSNIINVTLQFKCEKDGLFEDENDCRMYYECLWIGTQFERIDHAKCADNLIYNPEKHRCDEISEFEAQFSTGIQSQEDLIQFLRFRNCINPVSTTTATTTTTSTPVNTEEVLLLNDNGKVLNQTIAKVTSANITDGSAIVVLDDDDDGSNGKVNVVDNQTTTLNETKPGITVSLKASKLSMNITSNQENNSTSKSNEKITSEELTPNKDKSVYLMDEKMFFGKKIVTGKNISGRDARSEYGYPEERPPSSLSSEMANDVSTHMSIMKLFIRRRVIKTTTVLPGGISEEKEVKSFTTEPIVLTAPVKRMINETTSKQSTEVEDEEFFKRAKNRHFPIHAFRKRKILSIVESTVEPVEQKTTIDSIEQRLTKSGKIGDNSLTKKRIQEINSNLLTANVNKTNPNGNVKKIKVKLTMDQNMSQNEKNLTFLNFLRVNNISDSYFNQTIIGRKPLKFIKMLKKPNISSVDSSMETKIEQNYQTLKPIFIKPNQTQPAFVTIMPQKKNTKKKKVILSEFESLIDLKTNGNATGGKATSKKMRVFHLKPLQFNTSVNNYTAFSVADTTTMSPQRKYHYLYKNLKGRLSNETKKKFESFVIEQNNITRISELEKGGQFQRMLLQPADALIECKDNDFGLECSCSITLSPPKCKQLINSFLSSCRIVGCQNNGRCINMAYKYPIPYVCSCPSSHMGTYCEIQREIEPQFDFEYYYKQKKTPVQPPQQPRVKTGNNDFKEPMCLPNPCLNHGVCEVISDSIKCYCKNSSYTGKYCETFIPSSTPKPIPIPQQRPRPKISELSPIDTAHHWNCPADCNRHRNQGRCVLSMLGYPKCVCESEWSGIDCSQRNYCLYNDCLNNATCSNLPLVKGYICLCAKGYSGRRCEVMSVNYFQQQQVVPYNYPKNNPCGSVTCQNNGTCLMSFSHERNQFSFVCKCEPGYRGILCEIKISRCDHKSCSLKEDPSLRGRKKTTMPVIENATTTATTTTTFEVETTVTAILTDIVTSASTTTTTTTTTKKSKPNANSINNPCKNDPNLCQKYPYGNSTFVCIKNLKSQEYNLCLPTDSLSCEDSNPCLNGGTCVTHSNDTWKCLCNNGFTGSLCEAELCTDIHKTIKNHTMCRENSVNFKNGGLDSIDIELILDMHNSLRRQVIPNSSDMQKMYWDLRLQQLAQKRAQSCSVSDTENDVSTRQIPGYGVVIGENLAAGYDSWAHVLSSWISESKYFVYGSDNLSDNIKAGHYTQMIYSGASRIGCGYAQCSGTTYSRYFVCYYAEMQTYQSRYQPFNAGNSCEKCPNNCNEGLCDCKGVYCANGGTLDLNTCTCKCPPSSYTGNYCENIICPEEDSQFCSQALFKDKCWLYPVVRASCPYMCHLCTKDDITANRNSTRSQSKRILH